MARSRWATPNAGIWISQGSKPPSLQAHGIIIRYWFAYFIRISNDGAETAQLVSRHWVITNSEGEQEEVRGEGVVGDQPVLAPGASYDYNSFCNLKTPVGTMHGSYTMVAPSGETFEARIAPFTLAIPYALN